MVTATRDCNFIVMVNSELRVVEGEHLSPGDRVPILEKTPPTPEGISSTKISWDVVERIEEANPKGEYLYDLAVEGHENFMLANELFIHNSVIFNQLTGLHQHIGNWPGKTVEKAEGTLLAAFVVTLVPCAAVTDSAWARRKVHRRQLGPNTYIVNIILVFVLGEIAFNLLPGEPTALIMEMSDYRIPHLRTVLKQTWFRLEEYIKIASP